MTGGGRHYDRPDVAVAYREGRGLSDEARATWAAAVRRAVPTPLRGPAVDVGAGTGRFASLVATALDRPVLAVEPSRQMVAQREGAGDPRIRWVVGRAEALPLRAGSADLVLLSMVYHHLGDPPAAVAEMRRVLRPGGWVLVRTATQEMLGDIEWLRHFPEALALDRARMPSRAALADTFRDAGLILASRATVLHPFAADRDDYLRKIARRGLSTLQMVSDEAFARGLRRLEAACAAEPDGPVVQPVDLFAFRAAP